MVTGVFTNVVKNTTTLFNNCLKSCWIGNHDWFVIFIENPAGVYTPHRMCKKCLKWQQFNEMLNTWQNCSKPKIKPNQLKELTEIYKQD